MPQLQNWFHCQKLQFFLFLTSKMCDIKSQKVNPVAWRHVRVLFSDTCGFSSSTLPTHHFDDLGVGLLCQVAPADGHVVHQLIERGALVLLHLEVRQRVHKVKDSTALLQLLQEQLRLLRRWHVWAQKPKRHRGKGTKNGQNIRNKGGLQSVESITKH